jgi:hypothetical protein
MANLTPGQNTGMGDVSGTKETGASAGTRTSSDPANEPGQYPASLFGVALPQGTGAAGSSGASRGGTDPANEPGQLNEGISGLGPADTANTGAPGGTGAQNGPSGGDSVTYTRPGSFLSGTNIQDTINDTVSGTDDWTQAIDGSYGGGPQIPGVAGNMPAGTGAGGGRVLRGGYRRGQR